MAKSGESHFVCSQCGREESKWLGRCPDCGEWNVFREKYRLTKKKSSSEKSSESGILELSTLQNDALDFFSSGISELDRVLGGGIIPGSSVLLGGEPGIGKSTLLLKTAAYVSQQGKTVLYVTSEESIRQIKQRSERIGVGNAPLKVLATTELSDLLAHAETLSPTLLVVDSIQTLHDADAGQIPGTPNQLRCVVQELVGWCRKAQCALIVTAHVTKEGVIAGPRVVEHIVDSVFYFERTGSDILVIRAVKNRHASLEEIGFFSMGAKGVVEVTDASALFLEERDGPVPPGVAIAPVYEGSRILLVEIQALTVPAKGSVSRIFSDRIDSSKVSRISAILEKHVNPVFSDQDIYVNVAGGFKVKDVAVELPLALALYGARFGKPLSKEVVSAGEVTLAGEIRKIPHVERRIKAAMEMGFSSCLIPSGSVSSKGKGTIIQEEAIAKAIIIMGLDDKT